MCIKRTPHNHHQRSWLCWLRANARCQLPSALLLLLIVLDAAAANPVVLLRNDNNNPADMQNMDSSCQVVGYERVISKAGCQPVRVRLNMCKGGCSSYTLPHVASLFSKARRHAKFESVASCCRMTSHTQVAIALSCDEGEQDLVIPSATACDCFDCVV